MVGKSLKNHFHIEKLIEIGLITDYRVLASINNKSSNI